MLNGLNVENQEQLDSFHAELLNPNMRLKELKSLRSNLDIEIFQKYFICFVRQKEGLYGNSGNEELLAKIDYLINYYVSKNTPDSKCISAPKEGYECKKIDVNQKKEVFSSLNSEVETLLHGFGSNFKSSTEFLKEIEGVTRINLYKLMSKFKKMILDLRHSAKSELEFFDPNKYTKTHKNIDLEKILFGLNQKVSIINKLWDIATEYPSSVHGKNKFSARAVMNSWVEVFTEFSKYKKNSEVKEFLQQICFAVYAVEARLPLIDYQKECDEFVDGIKQLNKEQPNINFLSDVVDFSEQLTSKQTWKKYLSQIEESIFCNDENQTVEEIKPAFINAQIIANLKQSRVSITSQNQIEEFERNLRKKLKNANKELDSILDLKAIKNYIETHNNRQIASETSVNLKLEPYRGYLLEVSGKLTDSCWADKNHSINEEFPNITFVSINSSSESQKIKVKGGFLLLEAKATNGKKVLVIRGLNPLMSSVDGYDVESFLNGIIEYTKETAFRIGAIPAIVIDDHCGGSCSNRPAVFQYCNQKLKPKLTKIPIVNNKFSKFNEYDISKCTYNLS